MSAGRGMFGSQCRFAVRRCFLDPGGCLGCNPANDMDIIKGIKKCDSLLVLCNANEVDSFKQATTQFNSARVSTLEDLLNIGIGNDSADTIVSNIDQTCYTQEAFQKLLQILKPGGRIIMSNISDAVKLKFQLSTNGFMNIQISDDNVNAIRPLFEVGSSTSLNLPKRSMGAIWKLDDNEDDDVETIDPDDLLDEEDLKKPDISSLRVCGTTGKRKACKDCSCGLAEELASEAKAGKVVNTIDAPKSSCGSCYLGDAFRCATCPYLGMPAFKPGDKIQLIGNQLQADL
ncbi:hypothetical protein NQ315_015123 [Exocentrus adspersus]|uniref:Anamorsin homolog n=1 Tax=Exocentrus adspersus TaxID=1586481 RepID=A0AAV8V9V2_9CUCU|nr:hypothetical protein NQ315_015123 [Exocentrus adspersus]